MLSKFLVKNQIAVLIITVSLAVILIFVVAFDVIKQRQELKEIEEMSNLQIKSIVEEIEDQSAEEADSQDLNQNIVEKKTIVTVPETTTILREEEKEIIAIPETVVSASANSDVKRRIFEVKLNNNIFTPKNIIVRQGDLVNIKFQALDKDYNIVVPDYNLKMEIKAGQSKSMSFTASKAGTFPYYCPDCGGLESSAQGLMIISEE